MATRSKNKHAIDKYFDRSPGATVSVVDVISHTNKIDSEKRWTARKLLAAHYKNKGPISEFGSMGTDFKIVSMEKPGTIYVDVPPPSSQNKMDLFRFVFRYFKGRWVISEIWMSYADA